MNTPNDKTGGCSLLPCPFCGLTDKDTVPNMGLVPAVAIHSYPQGYRVECEGCGCDGPWHHQHSEAIAVWNRRPNVPAHTTSSNAS
jgi:Lar family restriction alleviation protein